MASEKSLAGLTRKELAQLAKHNNVEGWHSMKKLDLIDALKNRRLKRPVTERSRSLRAQERTATHAPLRRTKPKPTPAEANGKPGENLPARLEANAPAGKTEMLWATALGANWLYASWWLTPEILDRAEASLGASWHHARPVLRVYDLGSGEESNPTKRCIARIPIHATVDHWYVPIANPGRSYELQLGYETGKGHSFMLVRSSAVKVPLPGTPQARKYDEQRQGQSPGPVPASPRFPIRTSAHRYSDEVSLELNADLLIAGRVSPEAILTCQGEGVSVQPDGTFESRLTLEEGRQVIPLEAVSADGCQSRTVILAIERNTKTLEPQALNDWDD